MDTPLHRLTAEANEIDDKARQLVAEREALKREIEAAAHIYADIMPATMDEFDSMVREMRSLTARMADIDQRRVALMERAEQLRAELAPHISLYDA